MSVWYKKHGYYDNPFMLAPMQERSPLIGNEQQLKDLIYYIQSGALVFVQGPQGSGKTKLLRAAIKSFRGRIIYVDGAKLTKTINVEELLRQKNGASGRFFGSKPRDMILFLDNAGELSRVNFERIKFFYDKGYLQSVVFTGPDFEQAAFPASLKTRVGKRVIDVATLTPEQAIDMVYSRLDEDHEDDDHLIASELIREIWALARHNPRLFLIYLERVCSHAHNEGVQVITKDHLDVLQSVSRVDANVIASQLGEDFVESETDEEVLQVGDYYRNPKEEMFCGNCGAIVGPEDTSCPECHAVFEDDEPVDTTKMEAAK